MANGVPRVGDRARGAVHSWQRGHLDGRGQARYGGGDYLTFVDILHFRDRLVDQETIYVVEPFPADASRAPYAEQSDLDSTPGPPVRVRTTSTG